MYCQELNFQAFNCNQQMSASHGLNFNHHLTFNPDLILSAINVVLDWELPDEAFTDAVSGQAKLMAGGFSD